jgi:hypothetical protein
LKKLRHDSGHIKLVMTCYIMSKGTRVRHIASCAGDWLMNCPYSVPSRPKANPPIRDPFWVDLIPKGNHPTIPDQAHVKFADDDEHEIPFPCNPNEGKAKLCVKGRGLFSVTRFWERQGETGTVAKLGQIE